MSFAGRFYRPRVLAAVFGSYFASVMFAAWTFASGLSGPWYGPDLSRWVYMSFTLVAAIFIMGAGILGFNVQNALDSRVRAMNREIGSMLWDSGTVVPPAAVLDSSADEDDDENVSGDVMARELDAILEAVGEAQAVSAEALMYESSNGTVEEDDAVNAAREAVIQRKLLRRRQGLKRHQEFLLRFLPGPVGVAVGIFGISMAMIPASDGMLQSFHQLNTALILGFGYGFMGLAAYFVASIVGILTSFRRERKRLIHR